MKKTAEVVNIILEDKSSEDTNSTKMAKVVKRTDEVKTERNAMENKVVMVKKINQNAVKTERNAMENKVVMAKKINQNAVKTEPNTSENKVMMARKAELKETVSIAKNERDMQTNEIGISEVSLKTCGNLSFQNGWMYYQNQRVMNAWIEINKIRIAEERDGLDVICLTIHTLRRKIEREMTIASYSEGKWLKDFGDVLIDSAVRLELLKRVLSEIRACSFDAPIEKYFFTQGWHFLDNRTIYVTTSGVMGEYGNSIVAKSENGNLIRVDNLYQINQSSLAEDYLRQRKITNSGVACVIQLYYLQSILYEVFKAAKATPKYALFLVGKTGRGKSSISVVMTQPRNQLTPQLSFKSTTAGLESCYKDYSNSVMLVDDLMPVRNVAERNQIESNLETLTRAVGDSNGKVRCLDFQKEQKRQYIVNGGLVFTGEVLSSSGSASSFARLLILPLESTNWDMLSYFQGKRWVLDAFTEFFIAYVTKNYDSIVYKIAERFNYLRKCYQGYSNMRYAEYRAQLEITLEVLLNYLDSLETFPQNILASLQREYIKAIEEYIRQNSDDLKQESPIESIIQAVLWAMDNSNDILVTEECYCIKSTIFLTVYKQYCLCQGIQPYPFTLKEISKMLAENGLIKREKNGSSYRNTIKICGQGNQRFIAIWKCKLDTYIQ